MNKILFIGLFLLVATLGLNVASAAELNNNSVSEVLDVEEGNMSNLESINQESVKSVNQTEEESISSSKRVENGIVSPIFGMKNPSPFDNRNPNVNPMVGNGFDTTNDIHKRNDTNTNNNSDINNAVGPANLSKLNKNPEFNIIKKSKTFDYKGEKVFLAIIEKNDTSRKLVCFKATSSGLNGAGSSYVGEVGMELLEIAEEKGLIKKISYGASWLAVKLASLFEDDINEEWLINYMANGGDLKIFF